MNMRSFNLQKIRPDIATTTIVAGIGEEERFQNETLRPVIKMQNDLLLAVFANYIVKHKNRFHEYGLQGKLQYIENAIQKDIKFRNSLKGIVMGQFTVEEYQTYILNSSRLNKRMMSMVVERLKDQIQYFEVNEALV